MQQIVFYCVCFFVIQFLYVVYFFVFGVDSMQLTPVHFDRDLDVMFFSLIILDGVSKNQNLFNLN